VERAVRECAAVNEAQQVQAIVMDVNTGAVRAMAMYPTYDPADPPRNDVEKLNELMRITVLSDVYEPGSTFKIITAAAGLEAGVVTPSSGFSCPGYITVDDRKIRCHKVAGHGSQDFVHATMNSCNPVFITVGLRLGVDKYYEYFEKFGLKKKTGIDLPGEAGTIMHKKDNMGNVELATVSFGQSFQISAVQLLTTVSSIINGGNRITPHFGVQTVNEAGEVVEEFAYPVEEGIVSEETSALMREILEMVVAEGSGINGKVEGFRVGGKTATSQTLPRGSGRYISSFIGFAPADEPQVIAIVIINNPQGIYYGGQVAAPVIRQLFENILPYLEIKEYNQ
jgi:stage V sporulation protein D (sporulation-specific penicillin-binding protein)